MNPHLPPMPHGQPPMPPPPRRQHDGGPPYSSGPPDMRSSPTYMGYHPQQHPHPAGPYGPQQYQQHQHQHPQPQPQQHWSPYPQMPQPPPPPQAFQQPQQHAPLIVSSHPRPQPPPSMMPPPAQPQPLSTRPNNSTASPTHPPSFSSTPPPPPPLPPSGRLPPKADKPSPRTKPAPAPDMPESSPSYNTATTEQPNTPLSGGGGGDLNGQQKQQQPQQQQPQQQRAASPPKKPFYPPLPWLSVPEAPFPAKVPRRRRKPRTLGASAGPVQLPVKSDTIDNRPQEDSAASQSTAAAPSELQTPITSHPPSEAESTLPTTPSSTAHPQSSNRPPPAQTQTTTPRPVVPVVPIVPIFPSSPSSARQPQPPSGTAAPPKVEAPQQTSTSTSEADTHAQPETTNTDGSAEPAEAQTPAAAQPPRAAPKSWADLVRTKAPAGGVTAASPSPSKEGVPGAAKSESLADVLHSLGPDVENYGDKIAFVEPRGLVNTGNMCYMNSVLQTLVFCVPFYEFLERVARRAVHSFRSDIPLIDAMIMFMREYRIIDAADSVEQLRLRLKQDELEQYGESFIPEYVYQVTRQLPRFRDMRRGHQQDAQEFLGFLLEELHEECVRVMKGTSSLSPPNDTDATSTVDGSVADGWLEVGHKQKPAVTRSAGHVSAASPITRIFGGNIRSEFKVPGNKTSVTLEPYQSVQLDIGSPQVNNVVDALKGLTKPETMHGDFNSSRGARVNATKQVYIDSLPPVLILHLKRFHYDNTTQGTQKIWKKVGYPLELEIPKEVFPARRRNMLAAQGGVAPRYRLIGVIYHHGKSASGGHYTVDIRRQDGREWIRLDDTVIRRVKSEEVAQAGSEEDPKVLAAALERQKAAENNQQQQANIYEKIEGEDMDQQRGDEQGWSQVNGGPGSSGHASKKSLASVVNGNVSPPASGTSDSGGMTPSDRFAARDGRVAYLLFYERINSGS